MSKPGSETADPLSGGHVQVANRILGWDINAEGGACLDKKGVSIVDRMIAALISVAENWCADPRGVARRALLGDEE